MSPATDSFKYLFIILTVVQLEILSALKYRSESKFNPVSSVTNLYFV